MYSIKFYHILCIFKPKPLIHYCTEQIFYLFIFLISTISHEGMLHKQFEPVKWRVQTRGMVNRPVKPVKES